LLSIFRRFVWPLPPYYHVHILYTRADRRGIAEINRTVKDLATRARDGKLKPEEYQGGSFSISNLGMFGISEFSAVINPPQSCILAVGAGIQKVVPPVKGQQPKADGKVDPMITTTVSVKLSADRRVVDDAIAAQFLQVM
jgi:pyruvate dehydrogenase E2 component (dihydrolipoamide acetyltransferase)